MSASVALALAAIVAPAAILGIRSMGRVKGLATSEPKASAILITGCSSGIGQTTALHLASKGVTVFATVRKEKDAAALREHDRVVPLIADVAVPADIQRLQSLVEAELKARPTLVLAGVVNNAALLKSDPETFDTSILEEHFAANVFGLSRIIEAFLPLLLQVGAAAPGAARVVSLGSYFGDFLPGEAVLSYSATKHALEPLSDGMRRRLAPKGVHVALVKPGNIATNMNPTFAEVGPECVAEAIDDALFSDAPRTRYYPGTFGGLPNRVACLLFGSLPDRWADALWKWKLG